MNQKLNLVPLFIAIHVFLLFLGCNSKSNQQPDDPLRISEINVFENEIESVKSSQIMSDVDYITLVSDSNSIIGKIDKLVVTKDYIFVMDIEQSKKIFQFDSSGNFIRTIGNSGRGPGEYQRLVDFSFCSVSHQIIVLDVSRKLIVYNQHGELINEMKIDQGDPLSSRVLIFNDDIYLYTGRGENYSSRYSLIKLNSEGKEAFGFLEFENAPNYSVQFNSPLYIKDESLMLFDLFDGILFEKDQEQKVIPKYVFDLNKKKFPTAIFCDFEKYIENVQHYSFVDRYFIEGDSYIYYLIVDKMEYKHGLFSKKTEKAVLLKSIINDNHIFRSPEYFFNGYFYSVIEPFWLFDDNENFKDVIEDYNIDISGNPLIIKYKIIELVIS
jgi:hypothetical protein